MNIEIANRLLELRKRHQLSQEELAAKIGVSRQAVSKWERAEACPDTDNLILLANLYQVSLDDMLATSELPPVPPMAQPVAVPAGQPFRPEEEEPSMTRTIAWSKMPYPLFIVLAYLILGFFFQLWHPGWLLFLTIPIYYIVADQVDKQTK